MLARFLLLLGLLSTMAARAGTPARALIDLHQLSIEDKIPELYSAARAFVLTPDLQASHFNNVVALIQAGVTKTCRLPIFWKEGQSSSAKLGTIALNQAMVNREGHTFFQFYLEFDGNMDSLQPIKASIMGLAGPEQGRSFDLTPRQLTKGIGSLTLSSPNAAAPLAPGLYELSLHGAGLPKILLQFFWLPVEAQQQSMMLSPSPNQVFFTGFPNFSWRQGEQKAYGDCAEAQRSVQVLRLADGVVWTNQSLDANQTSTTFGISLGWERGAKLLNGDYAVELSSLQQLSDAKVRYGQRATLEQRFSLAARSFDTCRINLGTEWNEGATDLSGYNYYIGWVGWSERFSTTYYKNMLLAASPGREAQGLTPSYQVSIFDDLALGRGKLKNCASPQGPTLCQGGATFVRKNRQSILAMYRDYAKETAQIIGTDAEIMWFIEPTFNLFLAEQQKPTPLSAREGVQWILDIYYEIKAYLPFAKIVPHYPEPALFREELNRAIGGHGLDIDLWQYYHPPLEGWSAMRRIAQELSKKGQYLIVHQPQVSDEASDLQLTTKSLEALAEEGIRGVTFYKPEPKHSRRIKEVSKRLKTDSLCDARVQQQSYQMSAILSNLDFVEGDYRSLELSSAQQCADQCLQESYCRAYTYSLKRCYLKRVKLRSQPKADVQSGFKVQVKK